MALSFKSISNVVMNSRYVWWSAAVVVAAAAMYYVATQSQRHCPDVPSSDSLVSIRKLTISVLVTPLNNDVIAEFKAIQERPREELDTLREYVKGELPEAHPVIRLLLELRAMFNRIKEEREAVKDAERRIDAVVKNAENIAENNNDEWCALNAVREHAAKLRAKLQEFTAQITAKQIALDTVSKLYHDLIPLYRPSWHNLSDVSNTVEEQSGGWSWKMWAVVIGGSIGGLVIASLGVYAWYVKRGEE